MIKQKGFHSLEIHRARLKCERQKEAETTFVAVYAAKAEESLWAPSAKPFLGQAHKSEGDLLFPLPLPSLPNIAS